MHITEEEDGRTCCARANCSSSLAFASQTRSWRPRCGIYPVVYRADDASVLLPGEFERGERSITGVAARGFRGLEVLAAACGVSTAAQVVWKGSRHVLMERRNQRQKRSTGVFLPRAERVDARLRRRFHCLRGSERGPNRAPALRVVSSTTRWCHGRRLRREPPVYIPRALWAACLCMLGRRLGRFGRAT
jgi:hypothetical protein